MIIGIHKNPNSFAQEWESYCVENEIRYKIIDMYSPLVSEDLTDVDAVMWHFQQSEPKDFILAKGLLSALEYSGKAVFPNTRTAFIFDNKIIQKYYFELLNLNAPRSKVFTRKSDALKQIYKEDLPVVWKLKGGSGSRNVKMIKSRLYYRWVVFRLFFTGYRNYDPYGGIKESFRKFKNGKSSLVDIIKSITHLVVPVRIERVMAKESNYFYYQEFIPNNDRDFRLVVIGGKAFGLTRFVRKNDFRASGSGSFSHSADLIPKQIVEYAFSCARKLQMDCAVLDFVLKGDTPVLIEVSYGFSKRAYAECEGYWTSDLVFHKAPFNPYGWMIDVLLDRLR